MFKVRFTALIVLIAARSLNADAIVSKVSYSEAAILFADKALTRPRVELTLRSRQEVKGKLEAASSAVLFIGKKVPTSLCDIQSVRFPGSTTSGKRRGAGITLGTLGGFLMAGRLVTALADSKGLPSAAVVGAVSLPFVGGWSGAKIAAYRQDTTYILHAERRDSLCGEEWGNPKATPPVQPTLPLLPLQPSQP